MRIWWALPIIATSLCSALASEQPGSIERIWRAAKTGMAENLPSLSYLRTLCGTDPLCAARQIAGREPDAHLQHAAAPDSKRIRLLDHTQSVSRIDRTDHDLRIGLDHFGRKAEQDLRNILARAPNVRRLELDLRCNRGGDFYRMLTIAGMFTGPVPHAMRLVTDERTVSLDITAERPLAFQGSLTVLIGPETASSAEALAALLQRHARAKLLGARTYGKDYTQHVIPVTNEWNLLFPAARMIVPGMDWRNGLIPDIANREGQCPSSTSG